MREKNNSETGQHFTIHESPENSPNLLPKDIKAIQETVSNLESFRELLRTTLLSTLNKISKRKETIQSKKKELLQNKPETPTSEVIRLLNEISNLEALVLELNKQIPKEWDKLRYNHLPLDKNISAKTPISFELESLFSIIKNPETIQKNFSPNPGELTNDLNKIIYTLRSITYPYNAKRFKRNTK